MLPTTTAAAASLRAVNKDGLLSEERGRCSGSGITVRVAKGVGTGKFNYKYGTRFTEYPQTPGDVSVKGNIRRQAAGNVYRFSVIYAESTGARVEKRRSIMVWRLCWEVLPL